MSKFFKILLIAGFSVLGGASPGLAQNVVPSAQELNPALRVPAPVAAPGEHGGLIAPPPPAPCVPGLDKSVGTITITSVNFQDADEIQTPDLAGAYAGKLNTPLAPTAICEIRDRASAMLFHKGILARVEIPPQRLSGTTPGPLTLLVVAAYVASVEIHGDVGPAGDKVADYMARLRGMKPFDINRAQRYLLLAGDVPGVHIRALLKRDPNGGRGAVVLDIAITRNPYNVQAGVQNYGSHEIGPFAGVVRLDLNSMTSLGERTTLAGYTTADFREQFVLQGIEEVRLGGDGLLAHVSLAGGESRPGGAVSALDLRGSAFVGQFSLSYPLLRTRDLNLNAGAGLDLIEQTLEIGGVGTLARDHLRVLNAALTGSYGWADEIPGSLSLSLELRQGVNGLGASGLGNPLLSRAQGDAAAFELRSGGQLVLHWAPYIATSASYLAQYADRPLLSYEELAVGNLTIGRGYDPSVVSGDRGILGSFELHVGGFALVADLPDYTIGAMGFVDIAHISNLDAGGMSGTLHSAGGGLDFQLGAQRHLGLLYARPLDAITPLAAYRPADRILMNLTVAF